MRQKVGGDVAILLWLSLLNRVPGIPGITSLLSLTHFLTFTHSLTLCHSFSFSYLSHSHSLSPYLLNLHPPYHPPH